MWNVKHLEINATYKLTTDHEPPVEVRILDGNDHSEEVIRKIALLPEMVGMLRRLDSIASPFGRETAALHALVQRLDALEQQSQQAKPQQEAPDAPAW